LARACDATIVVSPAERDVLLQEAPELQVHVIPNVHRVHAGRKEFANRRGLLFIGNFVHPPNDDAMQYFAKEIFPRITQAIPEVTLCIVGDQPTLAVRRLAAPNIVVTGWVQDVTPYFGDCRVFVAPLRYGAGVKGKIGQSLSYGLPVVTTTIGAEGMELTDGHDVLIADSAEEFARQVIRLYSDAALWGRLSERSLAHVRAHFAPEVVRTRLHTVLEEVASAASLSRAQRA
jgi:glycosyltransferase involved in cell wall biosynthesis